MNNNATIISSLLISNLPKLLDANQNDFLIINLTDTDTPSAQDLLLDQQIDFNSTIRSDINDTRSFDLDLNYIDHINQTTNLPPEIKLHRPLLALFLACICIFIVLGNLLIMIAVRKSRQLRQQTTNYFVISLAFSDTLVGLIVMPFSVIQEVMNKVWIFGPNVCDLWHAFDVWGTTSSILSLCVISIDRYYAITKPFDYAVKMTPKKAKLLIVLIFIVSSLLSFPAIFWWRSVSVYKEWECNFPVSTGYIVFSSTLSFYGPLVVMVVAYYRIYRAAVKQTKSLKIGEKTISYTGDIYHAGSGSNLGHFDNGQFNTKSSEDCLPDHMITLRMHRGGNYNDSIGSKYNSNSRIESSKSRAQKQKKPSPLASTSSKGRSTSFDRLASVFFSMRNNKSTMTSGSKGDLDSNDDNASSKRNECEDEKVQDSFEQSQVTGNKHQVNNAWSISRKVSKLAKERKAAKTLGIVMGVFIISWSPFFITHIVMGICASNCDINEDAVYSFVTWLGWLNSGMNPIIYVCWSRDFRRAFRKVLCGFRESSQRASTGYSSYYFSTKFDATASSLARKRPLIDRHLNHTNRHLNHTNRHSNGNKLTLQKQSNLMSNRQQAKSATKNNIEDSDENTLKPSNKMIQNSSKPFESKSSPDLSNVIRSSDSVDNFTSIKQENELTRSPLNMSELKIDPVHQQAALLNQPISEKQSNEMSDSLNRRTAFSSKKEQAVKLINLKQKTFRSYFSDGKLSKKVNKIDRERNDKARNEPAPSTSTKFSLGDWFRIREEDERADKESNTQTNNCSHKRDQNDFRSEIENKVDDRHKNAKLVRHVEKVVCSNDDKFDKNNKKIMETNQASNNNLDTIDRNVDSTYASSSILNRDQRDETNIEFNNRIVKQCEPASDVEQEKNLVEPEIERSNLAAHSRTDELISDTNEEESGLSVNSYHCTYKITAEHCTKSNSDNTSDSASQQNDQEEFTIKIQLSDPSR